MRVHGEKVLKRRLMGQRSDYHDYLPELKEDFQHMCGYCGKSELVTKNAFEIDHFVPKKHAKSRVNDYSNLVYSCYECNRKKASKWPSGDEHVQFLDDKGFVDPATDDYDKHLDRNEDGMIIGRTAIGRYMAEEAFQFQMRPMREIWQLMQLVEKKRLLREKMKTLKPDEMQDYIEMDQQLDILQDILFQSKE